MGGAEGDRRVGIRETRAGLGSKRWEISSWRASAGREGIVEGGGRR